VNFLILLKLYLVFIQIGAFTFGGGYAMIPLFYTELVDKYHFITATQFGDIVAIAQMTPGPIGINAATYIGYLQGGIIGSLVGTLGLLTPSLIIISIIAHFSEKFKNNHNVKGALSGIRPVVIGLIAAAVLFFAEMSIFTAEIPFDLIWDKIAGKAAILPEFGIRWQGIIIFIVAVLATKVFKISVIWTIVISAALGILLMGI
jgi:chromate transporter